MDKQEELWLAGLRQGRAMRFRPLGSSMLPWLRAGDVVTVAPDQPCRLGDIVLAGRGGALRLHRLVARTAGKVITKGDALWRLDAPCTPGDILGRAVTRERRGREISLDSLLMRLSGLGLCLTISWLPHLFDFLRALRRRSLEKWDLYGA
jgi:hypothetical protein